MKWAYQIAKIVVTVGILSPVIKCCYVTNSGFLVLGKKSLNNSQIHPSSSKIYSRKNIKQTKIKQQVNNCNSSFFNYWANLGALWWLLEANTRLILVVRHLWANWQDYSSLDRSWDWVRGQFCNLQSLNPCRHHQPNSCQYCNELWHLVDKRRDPSGRESVHPASPHCGEPTLIRKSIKQQTNKISTTKK